MPLKKWDLLRVYRNDLRQPHDKYCICVCPTKKLFFYINSCPPKFHKKREFALEVENFEITCITKTSYIDTTTLIDDLPEAALNEALSDPKRQHGSVSPTLQQKIIATVRAHNALSPEHMSLF